MTTTTAIQITIPRHPPKSLNSVLTMNRWDRNRHARLWRNEAAAAWLNAGQPYYDECRVRIIYYARGDRQIQDAENLLASAKPIIDGLKTRAFPDDSISVIGTPEIETRIDNKQPRVEIELRPVERT